MTPEEHILLLTTARVLRAKIRDEIYAEQAADMDSMNEALRPFDPVDAPEVNEDNTT